MKENTDKERENISKCQSGYLKGYGLQKNPKLIMRRKWKKTKVAYHDLFFFWP